MSQIQLQTGVSFTIMVDVADDGHEMGTVRARMQDVVELPVHSSPGCHVIFSPKFVYILVQHRIGLSQVGLGKMRNGELKHFRLQQGAYGEEFLDVVWR